MRSILLGGLAMLLIVGAVAALLFDWPRFLPGQSAAVADKPLTKERVLDAKVFPREKVKDNARQVGGEGFATAELEEETIARLPAKPVVPKPPKVERPKLPPVPVSLLRPLIEQPGHLQTDEVIVRLTGIISPKLEQICDTADQARPCGREARTALRNFIRGRTAICIIPRESQKESVAAQCTVGGRDVAEWLVEQGWAVADGGSRYADMMKEARQKKLGLWRDGTDAKWLPDATLDQTATD